MPGSAASEHAGHVRSILVSQALLAAAVLLGTVASVTLKQVQHVSTFVAGSAIVFVGVAAAFLIPWSRLPLWAAGVIPIADVIAIALLRESSPGSGHGLLWAIPAMWIGSVFALPGVIAVTVGVVSIIAVQLVTVPSSVLAASTFVLPLTIAALSAMAWLATRRAQAQRALLVKQSAQLRRSLSRARHQQQLVTQVLDAVDFGVIRITADGELAVANGAHARLQGSSADDGASIQAYAGDGVTPLPDSATPLARARAGEVFESEVVWFAGPGLDRRALSVTARRVSGPDGGDAGSVVVSRDVTAEQRALRAREDLVASVSHELRTPMTSIIGYLELALDDPGIPASTREQLEVAERNATRLRELVADILAMSVASRHGVDFHLSPAPADVADIVRAAIEAVAPRAAEQGIRLDADGIRPAVAPVDAHRLRQVLDNLLSNAVKYNARGGTVTVTVQSDDATVTVAVADDGRGMSDAEQEHLFERFFRADAVRNSSTHGSGLGLAISRDIVRAHGGDIAVDSGPGTGSTFTVSLPAGIRDAA